MCMRQVVFTEGILPGVAGMLSVLPNFEPG